MSYLFAKTDYKKHTYLAIPEVSVLKEGEGIPVDACPEASGGWFMEHSHVLHCVLGFRVFHHIHMSHYWLSETYICASLFFECGLYNSKVTG